MIINPSAVLANCGHFDLDDLKGGRNLFETILEIGMNFRDKINNLS